MQLRGVTNAMKLGIKKLGAPGDGGALGSARGG